MIIMDESPRLAFAFLYGIWYHILIGQGIALHGRIYIIEGIWNYDVG